MSSLYKMNVSNDGMNEWMRKRITSFIQIIIKERKIGYFI